MTMPSKSTLSKEFYKQQNEVFELIIHAKVHNMVNSPVDHGNSMVIQIYESRVFQLALQLLTSTHLCYCPEMS